MADEPFTMEDHDEEWQRAFRFVEEVVGGHVVAAVRQPRWRPAWFIDVARPDGTEVAICFRGARREVPDGAGGLAHEFCCMEVLEANGIPVPLLYGYCPDPDGIVMARAPGRINLATAATPDDAGRVLEQYARILADIHAIDPDDFRAAGVPGPVDPDHPALGDLATWYDAFTAAKTRPEPAVEFVVRWLFDNEPPPSGDPAFLVGDPGQFLFDDTDGPADVTAVIDLELGTIGDPAADLGGLLIRDSSEPMPDITLAVRAYNEATGRNLDRRTVLYQAVRFGIVTPLAVAGLVATPAVGLDYLQYLTWYLVYTRTPLELIATIEGIDVAPAAPVAERPGPFGQAHGLLRAIADPDGTATDPAPNLDPAAFDAYSQRAVPRLATYVDRVERFGRAVDDADRLEAATLLGREVTDRTERDELLEAAVAEADVTQTEAVLTFFIHRCQREEQLLGDLALELTGARVQTLDALD